MIWSIACNPTLPSCSVFISAWIRPTMKSRKLTVPGRYGTASIARIRNGMALFYMVSRAGNPLFGKVPPVLGGLCIPFFSVVGARLIAPKEKVFMSILNAAIGEELSPFVKPPITQEQLHRYADASGDHNPIHLDEEAAHRVGLDSVIAHGMLSMAFLGQFISQHLADTPEAKLTRFKVRFLNMVRLDDTLTCHGIVHERSTSDDGSSHVRVECWAQNQKGEKVTVGEAIV